MHTALLRKKQISNNNSNLVVMLAKARKKLSFRDPEVVNQNQNQNKDKDNSSSKSPTTGSRKNSNNRKNSVSHKIVNSEHKVVEELDNDDEELEVWILFLSYIFILQYFMFFFSTDYKNYYSFSFHK